MSEPTDNDILNFIANPSFKRISQVSPILKKTIIEILKRKQYA